MELIKQLNEAAGEQQDVKRIVAHWKENKKDRSDAEIQKIIGNELEQLEYSPEDIERILPQIIKLVS